MKLITVEDNRVTKLTVCVDRVRIKFNAEQDQHKEAILDFFNNVIAELSACTQTYRGGLRIHDGYFKIQMSTNSKNLTFSFHQNIESGKFGFGYNTGDAE
jgi:hypothetical protein